MSKEGVRRVWGVGVLSVYWFGITVWGVEAHPNAPQPPYLCPGIHAVPSVKGFQRFFDVKQSSKSLRRGCRIW